MVLWFEQLTQHDVPRGGGRNVARGEMIRQLVTQQVRVPGGLAVTVSADREFIAALTEGHATPADSLGDRKTSGIGHTDA